MAGKEIFVMAEIFLKKTLRGFEVADEPSLERARKLRVGEIYRAEVTKPRDYKTHCQFLALLRLTFENQERYTNFQMFRRAVALEAGHVDQIITLDGETQLIPLPYDYEHCPDETEFPEKFGAAMSVCARILGDMGMAELESEVSRYADTHYGRAA